MMIDEDKKGRREDDKSKQVLNIKQGTKKICYIVCRFRRYPPITGFQDYILEELTEKPNYITI